jgi:hypothetical protein
MMYDRLVWTPRGRLVRNATMLLVFLAVVRALTLWSTPEECRGVRPQEWSEMCKNVMLN